MGLLKKIRERKTKKVEILLIILILLYVASEYVSKKTNNTESIHRNQTNVIRPFNHVNGSHHFFTGPSFRPNPPLNIIRVVNTLNNTIHYINRPDDWDSDTDDDILTVYIQEYGLDFSHDNNFIENIIAYPNVEPRTTKDHFYLPLNIHLPVVEEDKRKAELLEDYLKPTYNKEDYEFHEGESEKTIKDYMKSIEIPEEIKKEVSEGDFKYRIEPKETKGYFITQETWNRIKTNVENDFLKKIINLIEVVKFSDIPNECEEKEIANSLSINNTVEVYGGNILNANSFFLDLRKVEFYESDIKDNMKKFRHLKDFEKNILEKFKFVICENRTIEIENYLENFGLIVPEDLCDPLTNQLIRDPVLLNHTDDRFFDSSTLKQPFVIENNLHPYKKTKIESYVNLNPDQKKVYNQKLNEFKKNLKVFHEKLTKKFEKFYIRMSLNIENEYITEWLMNKT